MIKRQKNSVQYRRTAALKQTLIRANTVSVRDKVIERRYERWANERRDAGQITFRGEL